MKIKYTGALIVLLMFVCASFAQTKKTDAHLTGHVVDAKTREHIPYATVAIKGTTIGVTTDATGHFLIKNVPLGEFTILASFVGYTSEQQVVNLVSDKTIEIKFELSPQSLEIDAVVVTGSRNETNKRESATIVNVLSSRLFEKTSSNSVSEVLNFQSGLRVEQTCQNCGVPQLRINGLEGQYSQILLDSRPIFSSLAGVYGLEQMPTGMIERVEVIRGGGSALFGSSAIGGVVNIITKEPIRNTFSISNNTGIFSGGKDINTALNGSFVSDSNNAGVYLFGMIRDRDAYDRDDDGFSETPTLGSETLGFRGYYKMSQSSKLTAEYHHIREYRRGGNKLDRPPHEADIAEQLRHNIDGGGVKYDYFSRNYKHHLSLYTSAQNIDRDSYFGTAQNLNAYGKTTDVTFVTGGQYTMSIDKLLFMPSEFTAGAEYTDNTLNDKMLGYDRVIEQNSACVGTFLQNEWKNEKTSILIGARLDKHNKVSNPVFNPRVNLRYSPNEHIGIRASYSSGYRAPQAYDEDLHVAAVGGEVAIIKVSPDLRPEYSNSISASTDLYENFGQVQANLLIEGFYTNIKDVFTLEENGHDNNNNLILERRNAPGAIVKGINLELKLGLTPKIIVDAGYTFQQSRYKEPQEWSKNPDIIPGKTMFRSPDQYGYITVNYQPTKKLSVTYTGNYTGKMLVQRYSGNENGIGDWQRMTPGFFETGIRFAYDISLSAQSKMQVSCGVKNILDHYQRDIDSGAGRDAGYIYGPALPRIFHFGIKFTM